MSPYRQLPRPARLSAAKREPWRRTLIEHLYVAAFVLVPALLFMVACDAASLAVIGRVAAPVVDAALGAYADAARDAQRQAELAPTSPDALALRSALARLAEADARVVAAQRPVMCAETAGTVTPAPAVDVDALAAAIDARVEATMAARDTLKRTRRKRVRDAGAEGGER